MAQTDPQYRDDETEQTEPAQRIAWPDLLRIGFVALCGLGSFLEVGRAFGEVDFVALTGVLIGGYPILAEALSALAARRMTMELSMVIAITAACAIGAFFTAVVIALFVLVAEVLEHMTVSRGRRAIAEIVNLLPQTATMRRDGMPREVRVAELRVGDTIVIKPGSRLPVDGVVLSGHSFIDQSSVTGESMPAEKLPGAAVFAGTINQSGALDVRATRIGRDTAFGKIIESVEQAEQSRAPIQKIADKLAAYLVYFALGSAVLTFIITHDIRSTISVIIVAGACGIAAGTPLAIVGAIGKAARKGAIIKGGRYLEVLSHVDTVVLDKTGTLTLGTPQVVAVHPCGTTSSRTLIERAASAERPSEHPLARAILEKARALGSELLEPEEFQSTPGGGVVAKVSGVGIVVGSASFLAEHGINIGTHQPWAGHHSEVLVASAGQFLGTLDVADLLRPEATQAVAALRSMGMRTVLLTGDADGIARTVGAQLGVHEVAAELLPDEKLARVRALVQEGNTVAMVGDGINDAPALAQASVGIAMGSGTALARETADVLLLGDNLVTLVETFHIARRCRRIIMQNFWGTLLVDGVGVLLAACGLLNPLLAAFIHVASELAFILNSARLLPAGPTTGTSTPHGVESSTPIRAAA
jgi:Cd2+/Zn2+-exporting ATPase/Cu+-exporting ATPase